MARSSFALATALLFVSFVIVASALPVAERQQRHFGGHSGQNSGANTGNSTSEEPSTAGQEGGAPTEGTTAPPGSTEAASNPSGEPVEGGVSTESSTEPSGEEISSEPEAESTSSPEVDSAASSSPDDDDAEASPSDDEDDDDGSACFPADARVELEDGSTVSMDQLSIGDSVKVGPNQFSKVFMFTHRLATTTHKFIVLSTASGATLTLTKGHYIYVDGSLVAASEVNVGSSVSLGNGNLDTVVSVGSAEKEGLYNPQTVNGDVVVNDVLASTYTTAVEPVLAHAMLSPFRVLSSLGLGLTALESGGGILAQFAPRGAVF